MLGKGEQVRALSSIFSILLRPRIIQDSLHLDSFVLLVPAGDAIDGSCTIAVKAAKELFVCVSIYKRFTHNGIFFLVLLLISGVTNPDSTGQTTQAHQPALYVGGVVT